MDKKNLIALGTCITSVGDILARIAVKTTNNVSVKRRITKGCPQGSSCLPGFWNVHYNSLLNLELTSQTP
jgi:hypothetical protein